jgi:hypothetical protein
MHGEANINGERTGKTEEKAETPVPQTRTANTNHVGQSASKVQVITLK